MGEPLSVLVVLRIHLSGIGPVQDIVGVAVGVVHAENVQELGLYRDVSERTVAEAFQHASCGRKYLPTGTSSTPAGGSQPVEVLVAVVIVVEESRSKPEVVGSQSRRGIERAVHKGRVKRSWRHVRAGCHLD